MNLFEVGFIGSLLHFVAVLDGSTAVRIAGNAKTCEEVDGGLGEFRVAMVFREVARVDGHSVDLRTFWSMKC